MWLIFTHWLLLTWAIICCLFQSRQTRQSLYLHGNWNYQEYCVSTSIGKLNILETCIFFFFFFPLLNKLSLSNTWPGTASIYIYIYKCIYVYMHTHTHIYIYIYIYIHTHIQTHIYPVGWGCRIHRLLCRRVRPPLPSSVPDMTLWWGSSNAWALGNAEYPFIAIAPRSTLALIRILSMG